MLRIITQATARWTMPRLGEKDAYRVYLRRMEEAALSHLYPLKTEAVKEC